MLISNEEERDKALRKVSECTKNTNAALQVIMAISYETRKYILSSNSDVMAKNGDVDAAFQFAMAVSDESYRNIVLSTNSERLAKKGDIDAALRFAMAVLEVI